MLITRMPYVAGSITTHDENANGKIVQGAKEGGVMVRREIKNRVKYSAGEKLPF